MPIQAVLNQMIILFLLLAVGFLCGKLKIIDAATNKRLSVLITNVTQVALILASVMAVELRMSGLDLAILMLVSCGMYVLLGALAFLVPKLLFTPKRDVGTYRFMLMFGNTGFMGFRVIASVFGPEAVFYAALFNIPFNILVYSIGIMMLGGGGKSELSLKRILNPPLIASILALLIYISGIRFPTVIVDTMDTLGASTIPFAMLIIGVSLSQIPLKNIFSEWRLYPVVLVKLIAAPLLLRLILGGLVSNEIILGVSFVIAAMPVATNATLLTTMYGGNQSLASSGVFISTALSVATIPLLLYLFPL